MCSLHFIHHYCISNIIFYFSLINIDIEGGADRCYGNENNMTGGKIPKRVIEILEISGEIILLLISITEHGAFDKEYSYIPK